MFLLGIEEEKTFTKCYLTFAHINKSDHNNDSKGNKFGCCEDNCKFCCPFHIEAVDSRQEC